MGEWTDPRPRIPDNGAVAQLGERLLCKQEAVGSIPSSSTSNRGQRSGIRKGRAKREAFSSGFLESEKIGCSLTNGKK